jgi:hypothetical protein
MLFGEQAGRQAVRATEWFVIGSCFQGKEESGDRKGRDETRKERAKQNKKEEN